MVATLSVLTVGVAVQFQGDFDLIVGESDFFDLADLDAGHFHGVADFEFLHVFKKRV